MSNKNSFSAKGPSQRQLRVGEMLRRTFAEILGKGDIHDTDLNRMSITVGQVIVTTDLKVATIYIMPLMGSVTVEEAIAALARNKHEIRMRLAKEMTLKYVPELRFRADETFDRLDETRRMFSDPLVMRDLGPSDADDAV